MVEIKAADVSKLRQVTGAGMMDCKKALQEAEGNFDQAIEIIRKKGQAIANKRADREAAEGVVLAKGGEKSGVMIVLNCETDFVAKNADFVGFANKILEVAATKLPKDLEALKGLQMEGKTIDERILEQSGVTGEKMQLSFYQKIEAAEVVPYIHPGNMLATLVGFSKNVATQVGKDIAMQVAAMAPVAVDKSDVSEEIIAKEKEIGREQARNEGKPENMLDKIAEGKLQKFFKEMTLLSQDFTKDSKISVAQYLKNADAELKVTGFVRFALKQ
jgi:elongation factor Ts